MTTINTTFPANYVERVYAGVLGKIIGVYLGRPIEGWTYDKISAEVGEVSPARFSRSRAMRTPG